MDFMKVFDQTVREIKREVNLRVLKVPEIEQKVLDATSDEPWGPHGSALAELAQETKKFTECQMIMSALWTRLSETGANWRHVYKALTVIEYLLANGAERAVDDIIEHSFQISSLSGFEYVEPNGKDMGINVRKKSETISGLLNDREKIKAVREKASATRDKYFGLSSTGITYKSSSASISGSSFSGGYGGFGSSKDSEMFRDSYKEKDYSEEETTSKGSGRGLREKPRDSPASYNDPNKSKGNARRAREKISSGFPKEPKKPNPAAPSTQKNDEDEFDDFDPRGLSTAVPAPANVNQVDLFGDNLIGDLMDGPTSIQAGTDPLTYSSATEVDLFADASFVSAPPHAGVSADSRAQDNVDLFASQSSKSASFPLKMDLFDAPAPPMAPQSDITSDPFVAKSKSASFPLKMDLFVAPAASMAPQSDITSDPFVAKTSLPEIPKSNSFDPFAAVPLRTFEESDGFGAFTSNTNPIHPESSQNYAGDVLDNQSQHITSKQQAVKDTFQVKSGIWADSLSRGLIDLNITAPKRTSLADVGVVGGLGDNSDEKEKGLPSSWYMGRAMGTGTGLGTTSNFSLAGSGGSGSFSNFGQHQQFGNSK